MAVLYVVIPLALLLGVGFLVAFLWANRTGQFDDLEGPAIRAVFDDDDVPPSP